MIEKLERLKEEITKIQGIMIAVSTGRGNIDDSEEEYRKLYFSIKEQLKSFREKGVSFPDLNFFSSLWDFYSYWKAELKTYQERREYVRSLYKPIDDAITQVLMKVYNRTIDSNNLEKLLSSIVEESIENKESKTLPSTIGASEASADEFEHDIAVSFAGEDRETAEDIANALITEGVKVFYDRFYKVDMWGKKLTSCFQDVYGPKARFVMVLISKHYPIKDWTDFEFSIARGEAKKRKTEFILPVRLDDTKILGIHEDVGYLDLKIEGIKGIVDAVIEKLPKRKELHVKITKGIFVTTLGVNFEDLVENKIISKDDWRNYPRTCDKLEADLKAKLDKLAIGEYHFTEPSARNGETLSVKFAHFWDTSWGLPDFTFTDYWDFLEFRPVEEIYPDSYKEIKSMFREVSFTKGRDNE
ncbi:MAG: TIR domain-containing protein [Candidatus Thermoplasmatota archaeon]|nr:TIR domain-containing protein [Candidatus Thermoplasmatota archaeon]